jgi:putative oxidoreductase
MKNYKLIFWISTGLFSAFMLFSAYGYLISEEMKGAFTHLGFPADSFRIQLALAKVLGVAALLLPFVPKTLKGLAYAGFTINLVSALIAHIANGYHSYGFIIFATITLVLSYYASLKFQNKGTLLRQAV